MKKTIVVLALLAIAASFFISNRGISNNLKTGKIYLKGKTITVEIADRQEARAKGLSARKSLAKDQGMLFIFEQEEIYSFWMKDMRFSLDFVWIKGDTVVDLTENVPIPVTSDESVLTTYQSSQPVDKVLEVNAGIANELGIKVGDKIRIMN